MKKSMAVFWGFPYPAVAICEGEEPQCIAWDAAPQIHRSGDNILPRLLEKMIHQHGPQGFCTLGAPGPITGLRITRALLEGLAAGYGDARTAVTDTNPFFFCPSLEKIIASLPPPAMDTWWLIDCGTAKYPGVRQYAHHSPETVMVEDYHALPAENVRFFSSTTSESFLQNFSLLMAKEAWRHTSSIHGPHS